MSTSRGSRTTVGGLAVGLAEARVAATGTAAQRAQEVPARSAAMRVYDRAVSRGLGLDGPVFSMRRSDGAAASARLGVSIGYADFAHAIGGDWAARLRLVRLPACALTTPQRPECRTVTPLPSLNDARSAAVSVDVQLDGAAAAAQVFALSAGDSSSQGDYKATKLAPSSSWNTALATGGFSWNYPVKTPVTPSGLGPQVALSYSSQAVDGRTAATNNQGSWIGEGFTYEPGYIERRYKSCADDGHDEVSDQCWAFHNGTLMLSGHSGTLVKVDDDNYRLSPDDGSKVQRLTGAVNGDGDGEHWRVTTTDGMQYYFGKNRLPGWSANMEETESVWTVPVYGDDANEPCHKTSGFADSYCDQGWRWNLDYVVDPRGNVISYFYDRETNHYARGGRTDVNGAAYHRGGYLAHVDYGQRDGQVYSTFAPARVVFTTVERCIPGGSVDCDPQDLTDATAASWPDVPEDRICPASTHCEASQLSATFFTRRRLIKIQSEIRGATDWLPVSSWALEHEFKANDDNSRTLWLKRIVHSSHGGGVTQTAPAVELDGIQLPNRIDRDDDFIGPLIRYRLSTVKTDTGMQLSINYKTPDCSKNDLPTPGNSTRRCYPVMWNPLGGGDDDEITDWFHKYVVDNVVQDDLVGGNDDMVTSYEYVGDAAWRKSMPDGITKAEDLTWSDWRGYAQVIVRAGDGQSMPGRTDHFFLRGLSGGKKADGSSPVVTRTDSTGTGYTDHDEFAGHEFETVVYNGADVVSKTINQPWRKVTHTQTETWGTRTATMVRTDVVRELTAMPDGAQGDPVWREHKTVTELDPTWGRVVSVDDLGDVAEPDDDKCVRTWYVDNPDLNMRTFVSHTQTVSAKCADPFDLDTDLLADERTSYDLQAWNAGPQYGTATRSESLDRYDGAQIRYLRVSETTSVDAYGRALAVRNALDYETLTEYTETRGLTTQVKVTDPKTFTTTTTYDAAFAVPTVAIDNNNRRTEMAYDSFGRLTDVWMPDRNRSQGATPSRKYTYLVRNDRPSVVGTGELNSDGTYSMSYELMDGMLRPRQSQRPGPGGWLLTDTFHNGLGQAYKTNAAYLAVGTAGDLPLVTPEGAVNGQTTITYDGAGRPVAETFSVAGDARWTTTMTYQGDRTNVDPPSGGVPTTTVTNALGQMTELHQYHGSGPSGPADVTRYTYNHGGSLETVTDPLGNVWRYHYNQRGLKTWVEDPDSGDSRYEYDALGQLSYSIDERGNKLSMRYDKIGRKIETWQGDLDSGTKIAAWVYDTVAKGQLYYSQRIVDGQNYYMIHLTRDALNRPTKTRYSFPSGGVGSQLGKSYDFTTAYNIDGTVQSNGTPEAGGLPAEAVTTTYDSLRRPSRLDGASSYVTASVYGNVGNLLQAELFTGGTGKKAWLGWEYERGTNRMVKSTVKRQGVSVDDMNVQYSYDDTGNILSIADTPVGGTRDIQCFAYDHLRRLTEAWATDSATKTCADGVTETGVGGPAPYHHSWTFDEVGNRKTETIHSITGGAPTERTYQYPAPGEGYNQPHTVNAIEETGPAGSKTFRYRYDATGNTVCRPNSTTDSVCAVGGESGHQTLTWDAEGHLATSTPAGGQTTTYIYDADGNRIARKEAGGTTTLYLPGMELAQAGAGAVTGTRFYAFGGKTVAVRNGTGAVNFQAADGNGTASCVINAVTGSISWRRTTPYGADRGSTPPASWPDQKGFVGGTKDGTGLTHLGAREYDPAIGRFTSVDPIMDLKDPQQWSAYGYGNGNPLVMPDPSGTKPCLDEGDCGTAAGYQPTRQPRKFSMGPNWNNTKECATGSWVAAGQHSCKPAGHNKEGVQEWLREIVRAAWEAEIDPRLLLTVLIIESADDRSNDETMAWWDRFIPAAIGSVSVGMANMQMGTFEETVNNHPTEFGQNPKTGKPLNNSVSGGMGPYGMWKTSINDEKLSIRAAAYRLKDLLAKVPAKPTGTGAAFTREEIAAVGYNVGMEFVDPIGSGTYAEKYGAQGKSMGDSAQAYMNGVKTWWPTADQWLCGDGVINC
ncbi:RHS repeat-associated core domain-containing protein [Catellatospora coxensis]|uniref:RHS repeat-associated core domain-containing protein n=1 Tax=Catellatospora coxensis TaxID=310354 RepID=UPI0031D7E021